MKTLNKKKVVQTGIRMKDSSALRANSRNESYNETHVSEKRGKLQAMFTETEKCHNSYSGAGRSRSSLLGSLLNNNPHIMYWFEPVYIRLSYIKSLRNGSQQNAKKQLLTLSITSFNAALTKLTTLFCRRSRMFRKKSKTLSRGQLRPVFKRTS